MSNKELFSNFKNHDRFNYPYPLKRVTGGQGGEVLLVMGSEKNALIDCGMAYCHENTIKNIERELLSKPLDYIILTHTHYDHVGALPYLRKKYEDVVVFGNGHAEKVLSKDSARKIIKELSEKAQEIYSHKREPILTEGLKVDKVVKDLDKINLGDREITIYETPGHTSCSISLFIEPGKILIPSESTGILINENTVHTAILKSHKDSIKAAVRLKDLKAKTIVLPHYGVLPDRFNEKYWELFFKESEDKKNYIVSLAEKGFSEEEILEDYINRFWDDDREQEQPKVAFILNAKSIISVILKEYM